MDSSDRKARFYARTMHTPDDEARASLRARLRQLSRLLLPLHRALIEAAKSEYAFAYGPVTQPTQLLQLLNEHQFFAWLRPLTTLIVDIDETARQDFEAADFDAILERVRSMFRGDTTSDFGTRYVPLLQQSVELAIAHAAIKKFLEPSTG
jgi:hypothetical protein